MNKPLLLFMFIMHVFAATAANKAFTVKNKSGIKKFTS